MENLLIYMTGPYLIYDIIEKKIHILNDLKSHQKWFVVLIHDNIKDYHPKMKWNSFQVYSEMEV